MNSLPRVRAGLLRHQLDGQVLIYDARDDRVHLLDTVTGHVFELLEQGGRSREGIVSELATRVNSAECTSLLDLSLEELRQARLLDDSTNLAPLSEISRRDLLRKVGWAGAAAVLVPAIATLTASSAYAQGSCLPSTHFCLTVGGLPCCAGLRCVDNGSGLGEGTCQ